MMAALPDYTEITKVRVPKDMYPAVGFGEVRKIVPQMDPESAAIGFPASAAGCGCWSDGSRWGSSVSRLRVRRIERQAQAPRSWRFRRLQPTAFYETVPLLLYLISFDFHYDNRRHGIDDRPGDDKLAFVALLLNFHWLAVCKLVGAFDGVLHLRNLEWHPRLLEEGEVQLSRFRG